MSTGAGVVHNLRGQPVTESEFMSSAGTIASDMADALCATAMAAGDL